MVAIELPPERLRSAPFRAALFLLMLGCAPAQAQEGPPEAALQAFRGGDLATAARLCEERLAAQPDDAATAQLLGLTLFRNALHLEGLAAPAGERQAAFDHALRALARAEELAGRRRSVEVAQAIGYSLVALGRYEEATLRIDRLIQYRPELAMPHRLRGSLRLEEGDFAGAESDLARAQELEPGDVRTILLRARAASLNGKVAEAHALLVAACEAAAPPQRYELLRQRSRLSVDLGEQARALEEIESAIVIRPDDPTALAEAGGILYRLGRLDEADAALARALASPLAPGLGAEALHQRGLLAQHAGRYADARALFEQALVVEPNRADTLQGLAASLRHLGEAEAARTVAAEFAAVVEVGNRLERLENKLALQPADAGARAEVISLLLDLGRLAEAQQQLATLRRQHPDDARIASLEGRLVAAQPD